jgi:hypothetical protein
MMLFDAAGPPAALKAAPVCTSGKGHVTFVMPALKRCRFHPHIEILKMSLRPRVCREFPSILVAFDTLSGDYGDMLPGIGKQDQNIQFYFLKRPNSHPKHLQI